MRILALFVFLGMAAAQQLPVVTSVEQQPLAAQVSRLLEALQFLGEPLPAEETAQLKQPGTTPAEIQKILDRHCLVGVEINPESRVKVQEGPAKAELIEQGWRTFLVKVMNQAGITPVLAADSPNAGMLAGSEDSTSNPCARGFRAWKWSTAFCNSTRAMPGSVKRAWNLTLGRERRISGSAAR